MSNMISDSCWTILENDKSWEILHTHTSFISSGHLMIYGWQFVFYKRSTASSQTLPTSIKILHFRHFLYSIYSAPSVHTFYLKKINGIILSGFQISLLSRNNISQLLNYFPCLSVQHTTICAHYWMLHYLLSQNTQMHKHILSL